jgi:hypothetical protein
MRWLQLYCQPHRILDPSHTATVETSGKDDKPVEGKIHGGFGNKVANTMDLVYHHTVNW